MTIQNDVQWLSSEPEMILIPVGEFLMGSDPEKDKLLGDMVAFPGYVRIPATNEQPQHRLYLPDYYLSKTPITNIQYAAFVQATNYRVPMGNKDDSYIAEKLAWKEQKPPKGQENHPVTFVRWDDAIAYCRWLTETTGRHYTLPSEAEWEKGARGTDGRIFPWGDEWLPNRCNSYDNYPQGEYEEKRDTMPVGSYPDGVSPYGLLDMSGNVEEWTRSRWGEHSGKLEFTYPYNPMDGRENFESPDVLRVTRGGSYVEKKEGVRCACRSWNSKSVWNGGTGFRVAIINV